MLLSIVLLPLVGFILCGGFGRFFGKTYVAMLSSFGVILSCGLSWGLFLNLISTSKIYNIILFEWLVSGGMELKWNFLFDSIVVVMLIVVTTVSSLVHLYSINYMSEDPHFNRFMSYLSLFTFFMLILVTAGNFVQMFVGWEGVGLCSYLLVNFWFTRIQANKSAIKAIILNRIGDFGIGLALVLLFFEFQSLDYGVIFSLVPYVHTQINFFIFQIDILNIISLMLFLGAVGKSAQLGLHTWLPDAMEGPTPVSALIHAATMVTAGVFVLIRSSPILEYCPSVLVFISIIGALTAFFAATTGVAQNDLKRVIAYSTCSQLGYMVFICGLSNYTLALFHLTNHAFFKALLFLSAGVVIHGLLDEQDMRRMGGLVRLMPLVYIMMFVGSLALMGFPFLTGYYSKDIILEYAFSRFTVIGLFCYWLGVLSAFFTAFYSIRLLVLTFLLKPNGFKIAYVKSHDASSWMLFSLCVLFFGSVFFGYFFKDLFIGLGTTFWGNSIFIYPTTFSLIESEFLPTSVKFIPFVFSCFGGLLSFLVYKYGLNILVNIQSKTDFGLFIFRFFSKKWYFDLIYNNYIVKFILFFGYHITFKVIDRGFLELLGPTGFSKCVFYYSLILSQLQSGYIYHYIFFMMMGIIFCFLIFFYFVLNVFIIKLFILMVLMLNVSFMFFTDEVRYFNK